jgi:3-oxoacyl-[acyl-carrier-protein] synthase III
MSRRQWRLHDRGVKPNHSRSNSSRGPVRPVGITAAGAFLPKRTLSSDEIQDRVTGAYRLEVPPGTLERRTGISQRRIAGDDEYASTLAIGAARQAMAAAGLGADDFDLLIFASASRDVAEPATAHIIQAELGSRAHALDVTNACNSFINGIDVARALLVAGRGRRALVVTGETPTRAIRWQPVSVGQLMRGFAGYTFGDAGAAVIVEPVDSGGILDIDTETHSEHWDVGGVFGGGSRHPRDLEKTYFEGDGHALREAFEKIGVGLLDRVHDRTGMAVQDYARVLVHQVTLPYLERFVELTGVPEASLEVTVTELGNVASATLGVQLARVFAGLGTGDRVLLVGLGGGVSAMTMVWEKS